MENYVLDTDVISHLVANNDKGKKIKNHLKGIPLKDLNMTCVSKAESAWGFKRIKKMESMNTKRKLSNTEALFRHLNVLNITDEIWLFIMEYREKYSYLK